MGAAPAGPTNMTTVQVRSTEIERTAKTMFCQEVARAAIFKIRTYIWIKTETIRQKHKYFLK